MRLVNRVTAIFLRKRFRPSTPLHQGVNKEFSPDVQDIEAAMAILAPTRLVWHHEQAGIIPNSCPDTEMSKEKGFNVGGSEDGGENWFEVSQPAE